jgi:autotransporter-associated beta strand protein
MPRKPLHVSMVLEALERRRMLSAGPSTADAPAASAPPSTLVAPASPAWQTVPAANFSNINISQFTDAELPLVKPLYWFSTVANSVVETATTSFPRGFINIKVWRNPQDNTKYNARVLENHVAFAYFYSQNRSWNPYYGNTQVKNRLEAILDLWASMQNTSGGSNDGTWTEYFSTNWSLAPTSFGLRSMVRTLELLQSGPAIDATVKQHVVDACMRGLRALLKTSNWLDIGTEWTNQYAPTYGAAMQFAQMFPQYSDELYGYLRVRVPESVSKHQSPAEYLYEASGSDFDYTLRVHQLMISSSWHLLRGSEFQSDIVDEYTKMYDWESYNLIRQPNGSGYITNNGLTTRTNQLFYTTVTDPMAEFVPNARFLSSTTAEDTAANSSLRSSLQSSWGNWGALPTNQSASYPPGPFQDADRVGWRPTDLQRTASINALPYLASSRFIQQFVDTRRATQYSFIRRPNYYAAFNAGQIVTSLERYGLGVIWNPAFGTVFQDQSNTDVSSWGTKASGATKVYEASSLTTAWKLDGQTFTPAVGTKRLADGILSATYALGSAGSKTITFGEDTINVAFTHTGAFTETIPLLARSGETITVAPGRITLTRNGVTFVITFASNVSVTRNTPGVSPGDGLSVENFVLAGTGALNYSISFQTATAIVINADREPNVNDTFRIVKSGSQAQVFLNGAATPEAAWDIASPPTITLNGLTGDDTFIIDLSAGNPLPPTGLIFDGGTGASNTVTTSSGPAGANVVSSTGQIVINSGAANYTNTQNLTFNLGAGPDSLTLVGSQPSGSFTVNVVTGGTLAIAPGTVFPANTVVGVDGTLDLNGTSPAFEKLTGSGVVTNLRNNSSSTLSIAAGNSTSSFAGSIRDGASIISLIKLGIAMFTLTGNNTYSGTTGVSSGILRAGSANAFSPNSILDASGATVDLNGYNNSLYALADQSTGTYRNTGSPSSVAILSIGKANVSTGDFNFRGSLIDAGGKLGVTKTAAGKLTLSGAADFTGPLTVTDGTLSIASQVTSTLRIRDLSIAPSAALDLQDIDLVVSNASFSDVQALVFSGFSPMPDSTKHGIVSTTSQTVHQGAAILALFDNALVGFAQWPPSSGIAIAPGAIVGKYTYIGDTNMDGQVTPQDYTATDSNLGTSVDPKISWFYGDTNFDGHIDPTDYAGIDGALGLGQGNPLAVKIVLAPPAKKSLLDETSYSAIIIDILT